MVVIVAFVSGLFVGAISIAYFAATSPQKLLEFTLGRKLAAYARYLILQGLVLHALKHPELKRLD